MGAHAVGAEPDSLPKHPLIHSIWANFQPAKTNTIVGPDWQHLHGPEDLWQTFGGALINVPPGSFVQANFGAMDAALAEVARSLPPAAAVADLHAGVGTIGRRSEYSIQPCITRYQECMIDRPCA